MSTACAEVAPLFETAAEVEELLSEWESCRLPWERWTHAAHLTVGLWHLLHYEFEEALARVRAGIKRFNAAHGVETTPTRGYHETLTVFWMRYVAHFLSESYNEGRALAALANDLAELAERDAPLRHYSRALLFSAEARAAFVGPDLTPLPGARAHTP